MLKSQMFFFLNKHFFKMNCNKTVQCSDKPLTDCVTEVCIGTHGAARETKLVFVSDVREKIGDCERFLPK